MGFVKSYVQCLMSSYNQILKQTKRSILNVSLFNCIEYSYLRLKPVYVCVYPMTLEVVLCLVIVVGSFKGIRERVCEEQSGVSVDDWITESVGTKNGEDLKVYLSVSYIRRHRPKKPSRTKTLSTYAVVQSSDKEKKRSP